LVSGYSILYNRAVYPEESFVKVKKYGLPMLLIEDESVKSFMSNLTSQISGNFTNVRLLFNDSFCERV